MAALVVEWAIIPSFAIPSFQITRLALVTHEGWGLLAVLVLLFLVVLVFVVLVGLLWQRLQLPIIIAMNCSSADRSKGFHNVWSLSSLNFAIAWLMSSVGLWLAVAAVFSRGADMMQPVQQIFDLFIHPADKEQCFLIGDGGCWCYGVYCLEGDPNEVIYFSDIIIELFWMQGH